MWTPALCRVSARLLRVAALSSILGGCTPGVQAQPLPRYAVVDLSLGGELASRATGINAQGAATGWWAMRWTPAMSAMR